MAQSSVNGGGREIMLFACEHTCADREQHHQTKIRELAYNVITTRPVESGFPYFPA